MLSIHKRYLYVLFALSGFCALVYEILWTRYLSLTFGTTITAVGIVTATFMGGIALGSYLIGRYADLSRGLLRIYAGLELGIAIGALLFPVTLNLIETVYVNLCQSFPNSSTIPITVHIFFSSMLLLPPAACMGGTFPVMCRLFARNKCGAQIGRLYALNTIGATLGALVSGFYFIPHFGLSVTGMIAIVGNAFIAASAYLLAAKIPPTHTPQESPSQRNRLLPQLTHKKHRWTLAMTAMIGFSALAYELLWTRVFVLFLGNTTYAFSMMLGAYLVGIALGGLLYARLVHRQMNEKRLFLTLSALLTFTILCTFPFYDQLAYVFQAAHNASSERWWHLCMLSYLIVFTVMAVPTIFSGALLPASVAIIDPGEQCTGQGVGMVVLYNTLGAVAGCLVTAFIIIPAAGVADSFRIIAGANLILTAAYFYHHRQKIGRHNLAVSVIGLSSIMVLLPTTWNPALMNSGIYCYAPKYAQAGGLDRALSHEKILDVFEGIETTVAVKVNRDESVRYFAVNGKTDGGTGLDMATQVLVGALPIMLHQHPQSALVIGYGSGITVGSVKEFPLKELDCIEISPEVVQASAYFERENRGAGHDEKVNLVIDDGRNFLLKNDKLYDVIISEPSNPWQTGNANLFTDNFYRLAGQKLNRGGIFCQWIGMYDISPENLRIACNTLLRTFPHALAFIVGADLIVVASPEPLEIDFHQLQQKMSVPNVRLALAAIRVDDPADLITRYYFASEKTLSTFAYGAEVNSDDMPILEYSAHFNLGEKMFGELQMANMMALTQSKNNDSIPLVNLGITREQLKGSLLTLGKSYYRAGNRDMAAYFMRKAAEIN